ncbi:MAG: hypothetical protein O2807_02735 [bacterium]|nr:hypothetical protein [bacterium]
MTSGRDNKLTGQVGEHLVTAELGRLGIIATPFSGNVPDIDIVAYANKKTTHIQVKTIKKGDLHLNVKKFLNIDIEEKGQKITGKNNDIDRKLIYVCVFLGERLGEDEFYIFTQGWLQDYIYKTYLGRKPPLNIESFHYAMRKKMILGHHNKWHLIEKNLEI